MLVKCPECQRDVSDRADRCAWCGYPIRATKATAAKEKVAALVGSVMDFCKGVPRKKTLRSDMSRWRFLKNALHNIRMDQCAYPERIRDYGEIGDGSITSEVLTRFAQSIEISRQILSRLGSGQDAERKVPKGLIFERDISPYVECLTPVIKETANRLLDELYTAGPEGLCNLVKTIVNDLLEYEDINYQVDHKRIRDEDYLKRMQDLGLARCDGE